MTDLQSFLERLEAAERPDREIDADIAVWLGWNVEWGTDHVGQFYPYGTWGDEKKGEKGVVPFYTASLDAAIALVERVLPRPDWIWLYPCDGIVGVYRVQWPASHTGRKEFEAETYSGLPIALLTAMVKALIAEEEK